MRTISSIRARTSDKEKSHLTAAAKAIDRDLKWESRKRTDRELHVTSVARTSRNGLSRPESTSQPLAARGSF